MKYYMASLSKTMIQKLKQCREMELNGLKNKPCTLEDVHYSLAPLYKRGLVDIKKNVVDGKELHCVYLTEAGIDFLNKIDEDEKRGYAA